MRNTYVKISLEAIKNNATVIRSSVGEKVKICAVVKADAYGHGMIPVANTLKEFVDYFAVALVGEGVVLRDNGIKTPILIFAALEDSEIENALENDLTLTAASIEKLEKIAEAGEKLHNKPKIHLKIDTGMGRLGVNWQRAEKFITHAAELEKESKILCEGIYSHFSDSLDEAFTREQAKRFTQVVDLAKSSGLVPKLIHICSSRSIFLYPEYHLTMVRSGIALYGTEPEHDTKILPPEIKPALEWKTRVVYFKVIEKGEYVGYGRSYSPKENYERIITLPVGYADGFPRRFSNSGAVLVRGKKYPIAGRVCMDQIMVTLGRNGEAYLGDEVTLIGKDRDEVITVEDLASLLDTAPHEITTCISNRVPRVYE